MTETYEQLYKKYRPKTWNSLVGQERVAQSLQAAVKGNKLPTAYLFTGPYGTGKTSAAMLLAKAVNCLKQPEDGNPCNTCDVCVAIDNNSQLGVHYRSAANMQGVQEIRALMDQAWASQPVRKQVFILDEIHNLSKAAFDALLIPLEARTMPALMILCSTDESKIPATIHSRVQKRNFSLVNDKDMARLLQAIEQREGIELDEPQREAIIRQGKGSARDTLTELEAFMSLGEFQPSFASALLDAVLTKDLPTVLQVIAEASEDADAFTYRHLAEQLFSDARDVMLLAAGAGESLVPISPVQDIRGSYAALSGQHGWIKLTEHLGEALKEMTFGADGRIHLEIAFVKFFQDLKRIEAALERRKAS